MAELTKCGCDWYADRGDVDCGCGWGDLCTWKEEQVQARIDAEQQEAADAEAQVDREPTEDELANRSWYGGGVEGGIPYTTDEPGSLGENDWRL